ncbi:MAG: OmpH family outer membrane protein [bacterium]|nr:OmpH family outer membrane protein [bacterium]
MTVTNTKLFFALLLTLALINSPAFAGGVGYINYDKVISEYLFAKSSNREIENKGKEIQKFLEQKELEFNKLETPLQKKKFEVSVQSELKTKEQAFNDFKQKREEAVYTRIHAVSEKIRVNKGFDAILDERSVFSGGTDITDELIKTLNSGGGIN